MSDHRVLLAGRGIPPLNDVTPLPPGRKLLGVVAFVIPALILMSMPGWHVFGHAYQLRCPYLGAVGSPGTSTAD
jgi:hypothetical protein